MLYSLWNIGTPRVAVSKSKGSPGPVAGYVLHGADGSWTIEGDAPYTYATPEQAAEALLLRGKHQWMRYRNFEMTITPHADAWVGWVQDTELHNGHRLLPEQVTGKTLGEVKYNACRLGVLWAHGTDEGFESVCEAVAQTDWNDVPAVQLSDTARRVLTHLAMAPDAYLFGQRLGDAPLNIIDNAAAGNVVNSASAQNGPYPAVDRQVVHELLSAGYIQDDTGTDESVNVVFKIADQGHRLFPPAVAV